MSSSRIAQPGAKTDQRKIYIDWANNKLRKNGFTDCFIQDLQRDTADGVKLPRIIQAVIQEEVPATLSAISNDAERRQNIEACVVFLQRKGVNCSGFTSKDVSEGSMRAVLQLFFSLSHYKGKTTDADHPPTRNIRPTSPGIRLSHGVHSNIQPPHSHSGSHSGSNSNLPLSNHSSTKPQSTPTSPLSPPSATNSIGSIPGSSNGTTSHPSGSSLKSRPSQRRTAGSTIPTGMDFMAQRRVQYKNVSVLNDEEKKELSPPFSSSSDPNLQSASNKQRMSPGSTGLKQPESSGLKQPEKSSSIRPPEGTGLRPPEGTGLRPPEGTGLRPPEGTGLRPPDGPRLRQPEGTGLRPPGVLKAPNSRQKPQSSPGPETKSDTFTPTQNNKHDPTSDGDTSVPSDIKLKSPVSTKAQRSTSIGRSVTPGLGSTTKISKLTDSGSHESVNSEQSGIARPGGGRLQAPGELRGTSPKVEKKETSSNDPVGLKPPESVSKPKTLESKLLGPGNNIPGPSSGLPGPSKIGGGYQKMKLQNRETSGLKMPGKVESSPEPERHSSVPKPSKLQQLPSQSSRIKPTGSPPVRQASEPAFKSESSKSDSNECLFENESKSISKLALITQRQTTEAKPTDVQVKTPDLVAASEPELSTSVKSKLPPPPLDIITTTPETTPSKADNRSSGSSIGSFSSSINSQSESSVLDMQTPSPLGGRKYVRRTSPEGMSVDETASPRDLNKQSDLSNESKEEVFSLMGSGEELQSNKDKENLLAIETALSSKLKRAQSLSPKSSRRILPLQPQSVMVTRITETTSGNSSNGGSLENIGKRGGLSIKPTRSSLRSPRQPGDLKAGKHVTISPHSSVESFTSSDNSLVHINAIMDDKQTRLQRHSQTERPKSLEDLESHTFSIGGFPGDLHPHLMTTNLVRRGSTRSEKLDYSEESSFLHRNLSEDENGKNSTPELLETYENELSTLKKDLESKAKMLNMYETSMADLSSKVVTLKRTLDEKDQAIKHLTEEKHRWNEFPFDQHSLAPSRLDSTVLSDGGYSDGTPEYEKEEQSNKKSNKKKGLIGRLRTKSKKSKDHDMQSEVGSVVGMPIGNGKKKSGKNQPNDLMSISEYSTIEGRMPEFDAKSYCYDTRSEYGGYIPTIITEETGISMYEEEGSGILVMAGLLTDNALINNGGRMDTVVLGSLHVQPETSWVTMDSKICDIFKHHIDSIDHEGALGITDESILNYHMSTVSRAVGNALLPHSTPYQIIDDGITEISITLKGTLQESCDALSYCLLINASELHSYIAMLLETQWIVVMGTKGTCKSTLAEGLASYLELLVKEEQTMEDEIGLIGNEDDPLVTRFSIASGIGANGDGLDTAMRFIKHELPHRINRSSRTPILLFDNVYDCQTIEQLISAAGNLSRRPYIISTLCSGGTTRGVPLHQLMFRHNIRVVTCSPTEEPIYGILTRNLRKRLYRLKANDNFEREAEILVNWLPLLLDHLNYFINKFHSNNVALGPRVFMNCPLDSFSVDMEVWFINLWNHFVIPYLMGTIMAGIETYTADPNLLWIDVREWVIETYPWQRSQSINKLKTLNPEDVGWNHAVRPQQSRFMYSMKDDDTQSVLRMKNIEMAI